MIKPMNENTVDNKCSLIEPRNYFTALQKKIVASLQELDGGIFRNDSWDRPQGGGGISCVLENGQIFERAGINFSYVSGNILPPSASAQRPNLTDRSYEATGISLVLHPLNPYVPTVHFNERFFVARAINKPDIWWFGGGMDLTPYYGFEEDCFHFHNTCRQALLPFGKGLYENFKRWCDDYFFIKHRNEPRGIGGIFFDDFNEGGFNASFNMVKNIGDHFLLAYEPIIQKRMKMPYGKRERAFQKLRRGRYAEFNLIYDRGTLFGLQSGGRTESILVSMPPEISFRYDWKPDPGTPEARLLTDFLINRDWLKQSP